MDLLGGEARTGRQRKTLNSERSLFGVFSFTEKEEFGVGKSLEVYDVTTTDAVAHPLDFSRTLHGRKQIFTGEREITRENVLDVLQKALTVHKINRAEILFLLAYEKGIQPVLEREKTYNKEINNKIVANIANEITTFKEAEFAGEPIQYVSRRGNNGVDDMNRDIPDEVSKINDMMISEGKQTLDLELAHKMFICGTAYRLTWNDDGEREEFLDEAPFEIAVPDVENTFVVRRNDAKKEVVMGVTYVYKDPPANDIEYTVYTKNETFVVRGTSDGVGLSIDWNDARTKKHNFGRVSLIEYPCNPDRIGAFEGVMDLLNAVSTTPSNQVDGILTGKRF